MGKIFLTGDTHCGSGLDHSKLNTRNFPQSDLTKGDYVIILGDAGIIFTSYTNKSPFGISRDDQHWINWFNNKNFTTLFIDGNHENHPALATFPVEEWHGGKVHKIADSVYHLMRGQVFTIEGKTFFTMGGAESIDRYSRKEGVDWWPEEMPSYEELNTGMDNLEKVDFQVNYVLTHCAPTIVAKYLTGDYRPNTITSFFEHLPKDFGLKFDRWFFGHYHQDKTLGKFSCLYQNIVQLD